MQDPAFFMGACLAIKLILEFFSCNVLTDNGLDRGNLLHGSLHPLINPETGYRKQESYN